MTDYVLTGLVKRRAELAGEIEATHERLRKMIEELDKLDSVILQFDPNYQVDAIKPRAFRPPPDWARRMKRAQTVSHGASAVTHAVRSGDHGGGGASIDLSEGNH